MNRTTLTRGDEPSFTILDSGLNIRACDSLFAARPHLTFAVRVAPRASRSEISGEHAGALRVRIPGPPVEGAANRELIRMIARAFRVPQIAVEVIAGAKSKTKIVHIHGGDHSTLEQVIQSQ